MTTRLRDNSRRTHGVLMESPGGDSPQEGKGREGKGIGRALGNPSIDRHRSPRETDATMDGRSAAVVHWWFGPSHPAEPEVGFCPEFAMGDWVLDDTNGHRDQVNCPECLDWMHA